MTVLRMRKDVWRLAETDDTLLWYARAIARMQSRPLDDPTSWRYQAAIHAYERLLDPLSIPSEPLPTDSDQQRFWNQCQHQSWFFLPWHRLYLSFFEQTVAAAVVELGGPQDWALPYWNYSDAGNPNALRLPPAFRAMHLPDGSPNPLRVERRALGVNDGDEVGDSDDADVSACLGEESFISNPMADPGFGGPRTVFNHSGGPAGDVERVPHGSIHRAVGGPGGWMSAFNTAGLDPIFWLHHCNIDRLWAVWLRRDPTHQNPTEVQWLTDIPFDFHDASGQAVTMTPSQVGDTKAPPLSYDYEDLSDPLGAPPAPPTEAARRPGMERRRIPEMVGATEQPITLAGESATASVPVSRPTGPAAGGAETSAAPPRVYLNIENITGEGQPDSYKVYLNLPQGADPRDHRELYAGLLPMFGVEESSAGGEHPGSGLHYTLEITDVVRALEAKGDWDPEEMRVTFVPKRRRSALETAAVSAPVQVGRVSLYYS